MEFKDEQQAYECLKEWQGKLFLDDWTIKIKLIPLNEMQTVGNAGENEYQSISKCALISIGKLTEDTRNRIVKASHELTLVHELLHCKFILTDGARDTVDGMFLGNYEHMLIEQIAKSLIMVKYNLTFDWFKNF